MYKALVTTIKTKNFPAAVKSDGSIEKIHSLQLGDCMGFQVIIGKDIQDGTLGVFFPTDGQLSEEFAQKNDLIKRKDENGKQVGGMFEENRRVKSIRLKGQYSDGFWCPLSLFEYTGYDLTKLKEGDSFSELNGHQICNKYYTKSTYEARNENNEKKVKNNKIIKAIIASAFPEHEETEQFRYNLRLIPRGSIIHITEKEHGTSGRFGRVPDVLYEPKWYQKIGNWLSNKILKLFKSDSTVYEEPVIHLNGTRRTVLEYKKDISSGFYGQDEIFRSKMTERLKGNLYLGEVLYFELVGYVDNDKPIMAIQHSAKLKDKQLQKLLGNDIIYTYGCNVGQCRLRLYRIVIIGEGGNKTDLSWYQVQGRAKELGVETVRHIDTFVYDGDYEALRDKVNILVDGLPSESFVRSGVDSSHPQEGIVLRVEAPDGRTMFLKQKSRLFGLLEGYLKDNSEYVDTEEAA